MRSTGAAIGDVTETVVKDAAVFRIREVAVGERADEGRQGY